MLDGILYEQKFGWGAVRHNLVAKIYQKIVLLAGCICNYQRFGLGF